MEIERILDAYVKAANKYLAADRAFRKAKGEYIISLLDPTKNDKYLTELEINALIDTNEDLNNKREDMDSAKLELDIIKARFEIVRK